MFLQLGANLYSKALLVAVGLSLEGVKVFALLRLEYFLSEGVKLFRSEGSARLRQSIAIYIALAFLSLTASFGFTLVTVDQQVQVSKVDFETSTEDIDFQIENLEESLGFLTPQIEAMQNQMADLPSDYVTAAQRLNTTITALQEERVSLISEITLLKTERSRVIREVNASKETNVYGMFFLLGQPIGLTETMVMYILLAIASILIEAGMVFTSPTIPIAEEHLHEVAKKPALTVDGRPRKKPGPKPGFKRPPKEEPKKEKVVQDLPLVKIEPPKEEPVDVIVTPVPIKATVPKVTVKAEQKKRSVARKIPASALLEVKAKNELKAPSEIAYAHEGVSVDQVLDLFNKLSTTKGGNGKTIIEQKDGKWFMNYTKEYIAKLLEKREGMNNLHVPFLGTVGVRYAGDEIEESGALSTKVDAFVSLDPAFRKLIGDTVDEGDTAVKDLLKKKIDNALLTMKSN
jgi:hypothetical protein